jgi:hypothetical protein
LSKAHAIVRAELFEYGPENHFDVSVQSGSVPPSFKSPLPFSRELRRRQFLFWEYGQPREVPKVDYGLIYRRNYNYKQLSNNPYDIKREIFADVIAASLYAPAYAARYKSWERLTICKPYEGIP